MMKVNRDQITGALIFALGIFVFFSIQGYKVPFTAAYPGPMAIPGLAGIGFLICGAGIFIQGCKKKGRKPFLSLNGWKRLGISIAMLALYILGLTYIGFWPSTVLCLYAFCTYYAKGYETKIWQRILFSVAFTVVVFLVYEVLFGYTLPVGAFFE